MSKFKVEQYETYIATYIVEAGNEAEAVYKVLNGVNFEDEITTEYCEINEELGMPIDSHQEIADSLKTMGISIGEDIIPSIRSVSLF